ncbi:MAG: flagellar biosynthesis protein FlhF [Pirellulales bacterium]|nr:flagellar biosynthesis protein FlhF [Pirellulales bacterium]HCK42762.1 flagellar biosynthesis protein FlhF [Planctomycetaceae bacterium]
MEIKTFRAKTMQQALDLVRREMGMEATVLHTRELNRGLLLRFLRGKEYEIAASPGTRSVSRDRRVSQDEPVVAYEPPRPTQDPYSLETDCSAKFRDDFQDHAVDQHDLNSLAVQLQERTSLQPQPHLSENLFQVYTDMIESDIDQQFAQELLQRLQADPTIDLLDRDALQNELVCMLEAELTVSGPLGAESGQGHVVALVGPTGVGKTTTIAKLAANFRLRENRRIGLITVDTYRIAAVEQLRTYADIIDLPMEVVSTPREMREAVARMRDLDLVLLDTAGRSPRDEVKIQELKSMLSEAQPDEVYLVLSAVAGSRSLITTAEKFASVGTTSMLVTKIDEATCLGNLLGLTRASGLPISYLTDGQNVPDDIQVAQTKNLAQMILGENR